MASASHEEELAAVIAASPARVLTDPVYVIRVAPGVSLSAGDMALLQDETETTLVTAAPERLATAQRTGRPFEGPFTVIRLEISTPFGAPGFIAAATTSCADAGVNVFVLSTFSYDYLLVPVPDRRAALAALTTRGFPVVDAGA